MVEIESGIRENTVGAIEQFAEIASVDPLVAAMLLSGAIITGFSVTVFGVATLGAAVASIKRGLTGAEEPNQPA
jgi:multisubunit Na+/H+ antiporter MnhC subunit